MSRFESSQIEPNTKCLMSSLIDYWAHAVHDCGTWLFVLVGSKIDIDGRYGGGLPC